MYQISSLDLRHVMYFLLDVFILCRESQLWRITVTAKKTDWNFN